MYLESVTYITKVAIDVNIAEMLVFEIKYFHLNLNFHQYCLFTPIILRIQKKNEQIYFLNRK